MKSWIFSIALLAICASCGDDEFINAELCFQFDERSCQTDLWMEGVDVPTKIKDRMAIIEGYFISQGIDVVEIKVDSLFHTVVCQACDVCPGGPHYLVATNGVAEEDLDPLRLLNLELLDCSLF